MCVRERARERERASVCNDGWIKMGMGDNCDNETYC